MPNERPFLSASFRFEGIFDIFILMALSGTWLGLLGRWHWALDLFSHFRWQYLGICLVAVLWTLFRRRRLVLIVALASFLLNAWLLGSLGLGLPRQPSIGPEPLRVVSLNVLTSNPDKQRVLDYLRTTNADIIFFMEVDSAWAQALEVLKADYPHALMREQEDNFGSALFSRVPLKDLRVFKNLESDMPSIQARLSLGGRELMLIGTHPLPPIGGGMAASRDTQLRGLAEMVKKLDEPVILVGDLNSTPWSHGMRLLRAGTALDYRCPDPAWMPTWRVGTPFAIPIDHALCTPPLVISTRKIGPDVGSDHRPQELEVGWYP